MPTVTVPNEACKSVPAELFADEPRLQQVLVNLVGNSIKFTERGSVLLKITASKERIYFSVRDTGTGISADEIPHLFERFKQVDGSSTRRYQGTGIGLPLSREIVHLMDGDIMVESELETGTTVRFFIPLRTKILSPDVSGFSSGFDSITEKSSDEKPGKRKRILIAEDEASERKIYSYLLSDEYDLVFAENGREACEMIAAVRPDLVLMDISMPEMNGIKALERVRSDEATKNIPVIAVTARAMKGEREKFLGYGFNSYVSKPIDEELLMREMHRLEN